MSLFLGPWEIVFRSLSGGVEREVRHVALLSAADGAYWPLATWSGRGEGVGEVCSSLSGSVEREGGRARCAGLW